VFVLFSCQRSITFEKPSTAASTSAASSYAEITEARAAARLSPRRVKASGREAARASVFSLLECSIEGAAVDEALLPPRARETTNLVVELRRETAETAMAPRATSLRVEKGPVARWARRKRDDEVVVDCNGDAMTEARLWPRARVFMIASFLDSSLFESASWFEEFCKEKEKSRDENAIKVEWQGQGQQKTFSKKKKNLKIELLFFFFTHFFLFAYPSQLFLAFFSFAAPQLPSTRPRARKLSHFKRLSFFSPTPAPLAAKSTNENGLWRTPRRSHHGRGRR